MPIDPQAQAYMDEVAAAGMPSWNQSLMPATARQYLNTVISPGPEVAKLEDRLIPGPGGDIPVRIYTPPGSGPFPLLVYFHGGGWVIGNIDLADGTCRRLAIGAGCVVVNVEYRLAPENKFPAGPEDCYAATNWVARNASSINGDGSRIATGGDSAGGNLSAVISLMARDRGGPPLVLQVLLYPVVERNFSTRSYEENADGYMLTRDEMIWFWESYLRDESEASNPYVAPIQAKDLSGLPPALVITVEFDPLRDEGEAYAQRLKEAGVPTTCTRYDGMIHGFLRRTSYMDKGIEATAQVCAALKDAFRR